MNDALINETCIDEEYLTVSVSGDTISGDGNTSKFI